MKQLFRSFLLGLPLLAAAVPAAAASGTTSPPAPAAAADTARLDVNRATREELLAVPGIGPALADAILALRTASGPFLALDALLQVRGIGEKSLAALERHLFVAPPAAPRAGHAAP